MPLRTDAYYRQLVETTLRESRLTEPPVSLEGLAAHLGVPLQTAQLPTYFRAALVYEDGLPAILWNSDGIDQPRRKALAHVLAHLLVVLDDSTAGYPRDTDREHRAAEVMSEEMMCPAFMVRDQAKMWFNDYRYLARLFGMQENTMMDKMMELGIIKQRGIMWDY